MTTQPLDVLALPLQDMRLIEASAGTGKTYTIAALYLRLILGHGDGLGRALMPPDILVVTFTNAATEELRERIRARLTQAAAVFRGQLDGDDFLTALRDAFAPAQWPGCAGRLAQAAQWMDEAAIYTIHAWCGRMLRQHAFDSGSLFDLELETEDRQLLDQAACDYWRAHFYPLTLAQLNDVLSLLPTTTKGPADLLALVRPMLGHPIDDPIDPFDLLRRRREAINQARQTWAADVETALSQISQAMESKALSGRAYSKKNWGTWRDQMRAWIDDSGPLPDEKARLKLSTRGLRAGLNKNKRAPSHPAYDAFDQLDAVLAECDAASALRSHAAVDIQRRFEIEKQGRGQMGFDDLLTRFSQALHHPRQAHLAETIRKQSPIALIDEFQDTDPLQYGIFSRIYGNRDDAGLLMIGDPKQSIYAFRGADIHTYLNARRDSAQHRYTLDTNFRSTARMVRAVNRIFTVAAGHPRGPFLFDDRIPFEAVAANGRPDEWVVDGNPAAAMTLWWMPQDSLVKKNGTDGYVNQMAQAAATEITRLLNLAGGEPPRAGFREPGCPLRALQPADIAILVRDYTEARAIGQALMQRRVRSVYLSDKESVFDSDEAVSLRYILSGCADPGRMDRIKAALGCRLLDLSLEKLDRFNLDEQLWEAELERFRGYHRIWRLQGVLPMLRRLLHDYDVPARLLSLPDGERRLTNVLHLAEMLQTAAVERDGQQGLIAWLAEQCEQPSQRGDDQILRLESDADLIRVVTFHKAKGLEYPLVFMPFICTCKPVTKSMPVIAWHDENGDLQRRWSTQQPDIAAADDERLAEDLRLLYVGLTRAQYACWLGLGMMGRGNVLQKSAIGYVIAGGRSVAPADLPQVLETLSGGDAAIQVCPLPQPSMQRLASADVTPELLPARIFAGRLSTQWWIGSYSGLLAGAQKAAVSTLPAQVPAESADSARQDQLAESQDPAGVLLNGHASAHGIHGFPRGPDPGTFLHDLLEWAAQEGFADLARNRPTIYQRVKTACDRRGWQDWVDVLTDWLINLLQTPLALPQSGAAMALADIQVDDCQAELEFLVAAQRVDIADLDRAVTNAVLPGKPRPTLAPDLLNGMLKGFIDLVFCFQGCYYVVDYKSNHLGDTVAAYHASAMQAAMLDHRYELQYALYTLALHRLLKARLRDYDYTRHVGGALYLFLRGVGPDGYGVYADRPPHELIANLDRAFAGRGSVA